MSVDDQDFDKVKGSLQAGEEGFGKVLERELRENGTLESCALLKFYKGEVHALDPPRFMCQKKTGSPVFDLDPLWIPLGSPHGSPVDTCFSLPAFSIHKHMYARICLLSTGKKDPGA